MDNLQISLLSIILYYHILIHKIKTKAKFAAVSGILIAGDRPPPPHEATIPSEIFFPLSITRQCSNLLHPPRTPSRVRPLVTCHRRGMFHQERPRFGEPACVDDKQVFRV